MVAAGGSFDIACSSTNDSTCMTVDVEKISRVDSCSEVDSTTNEAFVALSLRAHMDEGTPGEFTSPFSSSPWKYSTDDKIIARTDAEDTCNGDDSYLNLKDEFPSYSTEGTAYLKVPRNADTIHFENTNGHTVTFDLTTLADTPSPEPKPADNTQTPTTNTPPAPAPAPVTTLTTTEVIEQAPPVVGYTEAPGVAAPTVMDKEVLRCGTAAESMEPGTTFFTDGTTGWTAACDTQMRAEYAQLGY